MDPDKVTDEQKKRTKRYSVADGSFYNVMVGFGEQFITPFAIKLGANNAEIGILSSFPTFIASLFQILAAKITDTLKKRKLIILFCVFFQALMWLPMFLVPFFTKNIMLLTLIFSLYTLFGNFVSPAWNSLMGDVVNENERGTYFGKRNRIAGIVLFFSVLFAGIFLNYAGNIDIWKGFAILFLVAMISRFISWFYLTRHIEPKYEVEQKDYFTFRAFLKKIGKTNFGKFVIFRSLVAFSVMVAAPFFAVYMLRELRFSYVQFTIILLTPLAVKFLTTAYWGRYSDKYGNKSIMAVSGFLVFIIPVIWLVAAVFFYGNFYIIMLAEGIGGFGWAGFELSTSNFIFDAVSPRKRARCVAYFNVVFGFWVLLGGLAGGFLSTYFKTGVAGIILVFFVSALLRLLVMLLFLPGIKEERVNALVDERKLFIDLVAVRPAKMFYVETTGGIIKVEEELRKIEKLGEKGVKFMFTEIDEMFGIDKKEMKKHLSKVHDDVNKIKFKEPKNVFKNKIKELKKHGPG